MSMRYAGTADVLSEPPPLPGQVSHFLTSDPYQTVLAVDQPGRRVDEDELLDEVGESRFGQWGSPEFAQNGFGSGPAQDETIRRRGAADLTREEEWDLEELGSEGMDVQAYLKRTLTGADDDEIKRFKAALMRFKQQNAKELKRSVFKQ